MSSGDSGLGTLLRLAEGLTELRLSGVSLSKEAAVALGEGLKQNLTLNAVSIQACFFLESEGKLRTISCV